MEQAIIQTENNLSVVKAQRATFIEDVPFEEAVSTSKPFIEANTVEGSMDDLLHKHIIPVFIDNEPVISHGDFIQSTSEVISEVYAGEHILLPSIRLSHIVRGRIPEARNKPTHELLESEQTTYYQRMGFIVEIPSIQGEVEGNLLSLCIGGVKAFNEDNLWNKKGADQHFKVFASFKNKVCTNLCVWTDGAMLDLKVKGLGELKACIRTLLENYNSGFHIQQMQQLTHFSLTEQQFATLVGRCRMYNHLPSGMKNDIPPLLLGDTQLSTVCKDFYRDNSFCRDSDGNINLWRLYNLFTGANKSSYLDNFLDRSVNSFHFVEQIKFALQEKSTNWFLN